MFISIIGFGFLGGISGVMMGTEQLNMIIHNTIYVPGHFHATVVVGTTLSFMALTYFLIPVLFRREMINPGLAKWQPYLFGLSMYFFCLVMMGAGTLGVSRRHWDMAFSGAALAYEWPGAAYLMMGLVGIAGIAAIVGGGIYIYITVGSLLWGKRLDTGKRQPAPSRRSRHRADRRRAELRLGRLRGPRHLRAGHGVPGLLHPVLLHQLEVSVAGLGPELIGASHRGTRTTGGTACTTAHRRPARLAGSRARDVLGLFKLRIGVMIMITALVGLAVTPGPAPGALADRASRCRCWGRRPPPARSTSTPKPTPTG